MAKSAAASRQTKRSTKGDVGKRTLVPPSKKRKQPTMPTESDLEEEDAGFVFTRPNKVAKTREQAQPTRSSPRNHAKTGTSSVTATATTPGKAAAASVQPAGASSKKSTIRKPTRPHLQDDFANSSGSDSFVALPVSDTPIIRKNKALRQGAPLDANGRRRSSLSLRGKRASSMGGASSVPHPDVPVSDFYKHIGAELPDPVRMKQLLGWCARRALEESKKPATATTQGQSDSALQIDLIARTIEEEVLKDLAEGRVSTSWYGRPDTDDLAAASANSTTTKRTLPHPINVKNAAELANLQQRLDTLQREEAVWRRLLETGLEPRPDTATSAADADADAAMAQLQDTGERFARLPQEPVDDLTAGIDLDLLSAAEAEYVHALARRAATNNHAGQATTAAAPAAAVIADRREEWLHQAEQQLEFTVDALHQHLHLRAKFVKDADGQAAEMLAIAAEAIAKQEGREQADSGERGVGTMDVLRAITRTQ